MLTVSIYELLLVIFLLLILGGKNEMKDIIKIYNNIYYQISGFKKSITVLIHDIMEKSDIDTIKYNKINNTKK